MVDDQELLLLDQVGHRLHLVPVTALRSVVSGSGAPDGTIVCTGLPSGQTVYVKPAEISGHLVPDDEVTAVLTRFDVTGLRPPGNQSPVADLPLFGNLIDPTWLSVSLGGQCDSRCVFCFTEWIRHEPKLSHAKAIAALDAAAAIPSVRSVVFTGGEPTIRKELTDLVRHAGSAGFDHIGLQSNGHRLADPRYLTEIVDAGVDSVLLSLHGTTSGTHDGIARRQGSFDLAVRALTLLAADERVAVEVNFVVCRQNMSEAPGLVELVEQLPDVAVRYSFPIVEGSAYDNVASTLPSLRAFADAVLSAVSSAAGQVAIAVANVPPCVSARCGLPTSYAVSQRRSMLGVSPFIDSETLRGEVSAKLGTCAGCAFSHDCGGFQLAYLRQVEHLAEW